MVRLPEELTDLEKLALIPISYSRLDTAFGASFGCEAKYFYTYIQGEPREFGAPAALGNIVHDVLENTLEPDETIKTDIYEKMLEEFVVASETHDPEKEIPQDLYDVGRTMLSEFVDRHAGSSFPIHAKEMPFKVVIGTALVGGFIDRVDVEPDRVVITDYKTGKWEVPQKGIVNNLQLGIYALAAQKMFPDKEVYAQMYYLRSGKQKGHSFSESDLAAVESSVTFLVEELIVKQNYKFTSNFRACNWCDFAKSGVCPVGAKRLKR